MLSGMPEKRKGRGGSKDVEGNENVWNTKKSLPMLATIQQQFDFKNNKRN